MLVHRGCPPAEWNFQIELSSSQIRSNRNKNVEALIFFRLLPSNCLNWKIYCDDHSSLSVILVSQKSKVRTENLSSRLN